MIATDRRPTPEQAEPRLKIPSRNNAIVDKAMKLLTDYQSELAAVKAENSRLNAGDLSVALFGQTFGPSGGYNQDTASQPFTLANANAYVPITLNRILLSYSYMTQGLLRTIVDQPVNDAFRGGIKFKSAELDDDDLKKLNRAFKRKRGKKSVAGTAMSKINVYAGYDQSNSDLEGVKMTASWARLFGGSGLIINTDQPFNKELNAEAIREDSPLEFIAADRWELILSSSNIFDERNPTPFNYYGLPLHRSRVMTMLWAQAPSYIRLRLQGWGMSILEESIRAVNTYLKFEKLLFELLDEAKIDVFKVTGFNTSLASAKGTALIQQRVAIANQQKNFQSALTMDADDDYVQKQLSFSGIADIYEQLRINLCAYIKIPMNKLFGQSAGGFSSGKDSLDNYNSTVEMVREQVEPLALAAGELRCQQLFGVIPDDLEIEWTPLDVLDGTEQETVKTSKQARVIGLFQAGIYSGQEACEALMKEGLLLVECEVLLGLREPEPPMTENPDEAAAKQQGAVELAKAKVPKTPKVNS